MNDEIIDSPCKPDPKQHQPVRWGRFLRNVFVLLLFLCISGLGLIYWYTEDLALYAIRQLLPQVEIQSKSIHWKSLSTLIASHIVLSDKASHQPFVSLDKLTIELTFHDLIRGRITRVQFDNPEIRIDPNMVATLIGSASLSQSSSAMGWGSFEWSIGSLSIPYGSLSVSGFEGLPNFATKFVIDWHELSFGKDTQLRELTLWDIDAFAILPERTDILDLYLLKIGFRIADLANKEIQSIDFQGGNLIVGAALRQLMSSSKSVPKDNKKPDDSSLENDWTVHALTIESIETRIANLPGNAPDIRFTLNTALKNVSLKGAAKELQTKEHEFEIADFTVYSPRDAAREVISLRSVFIRFSIAGLLNRQISQVRIIRPTIYVSEDLFWYMDQAQQEQGNEAQASPQTSGWTVQNFTAYFGRLILAAGQSKQIGLPLNFETSAQNVDMSNLASLRLRAKLHIPDQDIELPDYRLQMDRLSGDLRFAYPESKGVNNLVNVLHLDELRWRQFKGHELWMAVTFDLSGVHGEFGGTAYAGYLSGGFDFFFQNASPWTGWVAGTTMDCKQITDILAPQNFRMSGPLTFLVQVNGKARKIERVVGSYQMTKPGSIHVTKLDNFLSEIPEQWSAIKQSTIRIGLETLRDFDFSKAHGDFWFAGGQGRGNLQVKGPAGSRNFDIVLHP